MLLISWRRCSCAVDETDSDDEAAAVSERRERVGRLAQLDALKGKIERSGDDKLDDCLGWVPILTAALEVLYRLGVLLCFDHRVTMYSYHSG
eukprot:COSAG05_NODE_103_length_19033_cov_99.004278_13_plen_92_part_00